MNTTNDQQNSLFNNTISTVPKGYNKPRLSREEELGLPLNLKSLPPGERHRILTSKLKTVKKGMKAKFNIIYSFYRKEMYIPN